MRLFRQELPAACVFHKLPFWAGTGAKGSSSLKSSRAVCFAEPDVGVDVRISSMDPSVPVGISHEPSQRH
eukprot:3247298-Amphidinium_carterae.2